MKPGGAWPWAGVIKNGQDLAFGGVGLAVIVLGGWLYYSRPRPGAPPSEPWYRQQWFLVSLALTIFCWGFGWLAVVLWRRVSRARKMRVILEALGVTSAVSIVVLVSASLPAQDPWAETVAGFLAAGFLLAVVGGRRLLMPAGFGAPEATVGAVAAAAPATWSARPVPAPEEPPRCPRRPPAHRFSPGRRNRLSSWPGHRKNFPPLPRWAE